MEAGVIFVDFDQCFDDENQSWASDDTRDSGLAIQLDDSTWPHLPGERTLPVIHVVQ